MKENTMIIIGIMVIIIEIITISLLLYIIKKTNKKIERHYLQQFTDEIFKDLCNPQIRSITYNYAGIYFCIDKEKLREIYKEKLSHENFKENFKEKLK